MDRPSAGIRSFVELEQVHFIAIQELSFCPLVASISIAVRSGVGNGADHDVTVVGNITGHAVIVITSKLTDTDVPVRVTILGSISKLERSIHYLEEFSTMLLGVIGNLAFDHVLDNSGDLSAFATKCVAFLDEVCII